MERAGGVALCMSVSWGEGAVWVGPIGKSLLAALRHLERELSFLSGDGGGRGSGGTPILVSVASVADGVFSVMRTVGVSGRAMAVWALGWSVITTFLVHAFCRVFCPFLFVALAARELGVVVFFCERLVMVSGSMRRKLRRN